MLPERLCNAQQLQSVIVWCRTGQITPGYYTFTLQADRVPLHPQNTTVVPGKDGAHFSSTGLQRFFLAQGFRGLTFDSTAPRLTHVQGIMSSCHLVPGNSSLGQWQWPLCLSPSHFLPHSWPHHPETAIWAAGSLQRESMVIRPGLRCIYIWSNFSL